MHLLTGVAVCASLFAGTQTELIGGNEHPFAERFPAPEEKSKRGAQNDKCALDTNMKKPNPISEELIAPCGGNWQIY